MTVDQVASRASAFLSDPGQTHFTTAVLLVFIEQALDELQAELILHGSSFLKASSDSTQDPSSVVVELVRLLI